MNTHTPQKSRARKIFVDLLSNYESGHFPMHTVVIQSSFPQERKSGVG